MSDLGRINLLIGPNNVGKSNVGRALVRVRQILKEYADIDAWAQVSGNSWAAPRAIRFDLIEADHWLRAGDPITINIAINVDLLKAPLALPSGYLDGEFIKVCLILSREVVNTVSSGVLSVSPISSNGQDVISGGPMPRLLTAGGAYVDVAQAVHQWYRYVAVAVCKVLHNSIIEIKALRDPSRASDQRIKGSTDGGEIIRALLERQEDTNNQLFWAELDKDLESWFATLLGEDGLRIYISTNRFGIQVQRSGRPLRLNLEDLGAGVSEILMMLAFLRLHKNDRFFVLLDEPEAHLHPGAVIELFRIIGESLSNHQFLITTHSTALVDGEDASWRIFRAYRGEGGGTQIERLATTEGELALLADMGIRPSQLFLARSTLWVEGPSDVLYWKALLQQVAPELVVGRDYAFVIYGGAIASHLDFNSDDDGAASERLVNVLSVSHRAAIICDADVSEGSVERNLISRLRVAAEELPNNALVEVSSGREIENGVVQDILLEALMAIRPKQLRPRNEDAISLSYEDYKIEVDQSFDKIVSAAARRANGQALTDAQRDSISKRLNERKYGLASWIAEKSRQGNIFTEGALSKGRRIAKWIK